MAVVAQPALWLRRWAGRPPGLLLLLLLASTTLARDAFVAPAATSAATLVTSRYHGSVPTRTWPAKVLTVRGDDEASVLRRALAQSGRGYSVPETPLTGGTRDSIATKKHRTSLKNVSHCTTAEECTNTAPELPVIASTDYRGCHDSSGHCRDASVTNIAASQRLQPPRALTTALAHRSLCRSAPSRAASTTTPDWFTTLSQNVVVFGLLFTALFVTGAHESRDREDTDWLRSQSYCYFFFMTASVHTPLHLTIRSTCLVMANVCALVVDVCASTVAGDHSRLHVTFRSKFLQRTSSICFAAGAQTPATGAGALGSTVYQTNEDGVTVGQTDAQGWIPPCRYWKPPAWRSKEKVW